MTIVLGIKTPQGVVLAADTQESYEGSHKVNRPKLVYNSENNLCGLPVGMAVAGAGFGPWIDKLTSLMWDAVQDATSLDEACEKTEKEIKDRYREYNDLLADTNTELIYGIGASGATKLFHAYGPIVNEINRRASGSGQSIADFLLRNFSDTAHITNATAWAIHILYSAKGHADGCGGDTQIAVIQNTGKNGILETDHISAIENLVGQASKYTDVFLMAAANPTMTDRA